MTEEKAASTETPVTEPISKAPDAVETPVADSKPEPAKDQKDSDDSVSEPANVEEPEDKANTTEEKPANGAVSNGHEEQKKPVTNGKTRSQNGKETASESLEEEKVTKPSAPKKKRTERKPDSAASTTNDSFEVGTVVLAKVKGYPSWPGIIVPESFVPAEVLAAKPKSSNNRRKSSASSAEVDSTIYLVRFFVDISYTWATRNDIQLLTPADAREGLKKSKKAKRLMEAYQVAMTPPTLKEVESEIKEFAAIDEDVEMNDAESEEEPKPAKKRKAASVSTTPKKTLSKKPARGASKDAFDPDTEMTDAPKTRRSTRKSSSVDSSETASSKRKSPSSSATETTPLKKTKTSDKPDSSSTPAAAAVDTTPTTTTTTTTTITTTTAAAGKADQADDTYKHLRSIRHRLQRMYINEDKKHDGKVLSAMLNRLSNMGAIELSIIRETKIRKVLNAILKRLDTVEDADKYDIKERILDLVRSWSENEVHHQDNESRSSTANSESK